MNLVDSIKKHEGLSLTVYQCTTGANTIGYGRNLDTNGITKQEAELLLMNDIKNATKQAKTLDFYQGLTAVRQEVIIELVYNLGLKGFKTFSRAIKAISLKDISSYLFFCLSEQLPPKQIYHWGKQRFSALPPLP